MPQKAIVAFNPFRLHNGSSRVNQTQIQEIVYYTESRFRKILPAIHQADNRNKIWMEKILNHELVFYMSLNDLNY